MNQPEGLARETTCDHGYDLVSRYLCTAQDEMWAVAMISTVGGFSFPLLHRVLRAMKAFEEEEAMIMEGVPDWKVGESVYHTDKWMRPHPAQLKDF